MLAAFGAKERPVRVAGGQGASWIAGGVVLKPLDMAAEALAWQADVLGRIPWEGVRVATPARAADGSLVVDAWTAWPLLEGRHEAGRWADIVAVGERFHVAVAAVPRPAFIAQRTDPWAIADRVAWGELPADAAPAVKHVDRLLAARRPVDLPSQVVHADLTGNVLFEPGLPPAVIDVSPLWRPAGYAAAIVVADALVWEGAGEELLGAVAAVDELPQLLLRALVFRAVVDRLFRLDEPVRPDDADPYLAPVELACRLAGSEGAALP